MERSNKYCIIMAGGVGSRFWPISRNSKPKQFLDILGTGSTFLQDTFNRFAKIMPKENILVVTSEIYSELVKEQLPEITSDNILLEPCRRNTAPCIAYATYKLYRNNPNAVVVVAPSDHLILNEDSFLSIVDCALNVASKENNLYTLGVKPTRPETGYGYIQANTAEVNKVDNYSYYSVKTFTEKPNKELAKVLVDSGEFFWNSGIFVWSLEAIKEELERYLPSVAMLFKDGNSFYYTDKEREYINTIYEDCTSISIDYGVMEKTDKSWVFEATFGWSDLGTWKSLYLQRERDSNENMIVVKPIMLSDTEGSIIVSTEKDKLVVVEGLKNYMVINTEDVLMVCPKDESVIKNITTDLNTEEYSDYQ